MTTTTRKFNRFASQNFGRSPLYTCESCGKRTRETGEGESDCRLCKKCFITASQENHHSDNCAGRMADCAECKSYLAQYGYTPADCDTWCDKEEDPVVIEQESAVVASVGPKRLTVKAVTKAIREAGLDGELVRGNGFYYFHGKSFGPRCSLNTIFTRHIDAISLASWVGDAKHSSEKYLELRKELDTPLTDAEAKEAKAATKRSMEELDRLQVPMSERSPEEVEDVIEFATKKLETELKTAAPVVEDLNKHFALKFSEDSAMDAVQALTAMGCTNVKARCVDLDSETVTVDFETTMALSEVKSLLRHTNAVL